MMVRFGDSQRLIGGGLTPPLQNMSAIVGAGFTPARKTTYIVAFSIRFHYFPEDYEFLHVLGSLPQR